MNKRDFIVQGGGTLLAGATWLPAIACPEAGSNHGQASAQADVAAASGGAPRQLPDWQARQGLVFDAHTPLGRPVGLLLSEAKARDDASAHTALQQFTVSLQGPRGLPLPAGLHTLHHPETGPVALYLQPVQHGELITYDAHFSLTI